MSLRKKILYQKLTTFKIKRSLKSFVFDIIDKKIIQRLEFLSTIYSKSYPGKRAIFAHDHIGIQINQFGVYEKLSLEILFQFLIPINKELETSLALDIGANIGNHSMFFSQKFAQVYSFEPNPKTFCLLSFNTGFYGNIKVFQIGLGDEEKKMQLNENFENMGMASIKYKHSSSESVMVDVKCLDDIVEPHEKICLVKIDVEGFEAKVIKGGFKTLKKNEPIVIFEQHKNEFVNGSTEAIDLLKDLGYRLCWFEASISRKNWFYRRFNSIKTLFFGKPYTYDMVTAESVPVKEYGMLIAIPTRFHEKLGLKI